MTMGLGMEKAAMGSPTRHALRSDLQELQVRRQEEQRNRMPRVYPFCREEARR